MVVSSSNPFSGYERYCRLRNQVLELVPFPDVVVYLNAVPQDCLQRIAERGRVIKRLPNGQNFEKN